MSLQRPVAAARRQLCPHTTSSIGAGGTVKQKAAIAGVLAVLGTGSVLSGAASLENVLNAGIAAVSAA